LAPQAATEYTPHSGGIVGDFHEKAADGFLLKAIAVIAGSRNKA
jgi:hypothetical protein